jgi:hypothetical protein
LPTIDLSIPPPAPDGVLDALPRRAALTLPELRLVAEAAGGAPLPFDVAEPGQAPALEERLGQSRGTVEDQAYLAVLDSLHDPRASLERRGLLADGTVDEGLLGAVGLLATPELALDIDVVANQVQAKGWHRQAGRAVATLSTVDGIVFELAWFPTASWPAELGRVAEVPEDITLHESTVPAHVDLPYELADAAGEALHSSRADLVDLLAARHAGEVHDAEGAPLSEVETGQVLAALTFEARGRLRVLAADVSGDETSVVGVVSWLLLADGWRALTPHRTDGTPRVAVRAVEPGDLATHLAPVLAEVTR